MCIRAMIAAAQPTGCAVQGYKRVHASHYGACWPTLAAAAHVLIASYGWQPSHQQDVQCEDARGCMSLMLWSRWLTLAAAAHVLIASYGCVALESSTGCAVQGCLCANWCIIFSCTELPATAAGDCICYSKAIVWFCKCAAHSMRWAPFFVLWFASLFSSLPVHNCSAG
jgi:hypothetical protein